MVPWVGPALGHVCLLAIADTSAAGRADRPVDKLAAAGRTVVDDITPSDNNVAQRNVTVVGLSPWPPGALTDNLVVRNPFPHPITVRLRADVPAGWQLHTQSPALGEAFPMEPFGEAPVTVTITPQQGGTGLARLIQTVVVEGQDQPLGGYTFHFLSRLWLPSALLDSPAALPGPPPPLRGALSLPEEG
jgi:hypothetical protein